MLATLIPISFICDFYFAFFFKCDGVVISKHHERIKCTSKCLKDSNKASHFFQLWIIFLDLCQTFKKNSNSADLYHLYVLGAKLHQHLHHLYPLLANIFSRSFMLSPDIFVFAFFS